VLRVRAGVRAVRRPRRQCEGRRSQRGRLQEDRQSTRLCPRFHPLEAIGAPRHQAGERAGVRAGHEQGETVRLWLHEARGHTREQNSLHVGAVPAARDPRDHQEREVRVQEELRLLAVRHRSIRLSDW